MEGKVAVVICFMVLAFLSSLLVASARDPKLGLPLEGILEPLASSGVGVPQCCNSCRYLPRAGRYVCDDRTEMERGCRNGCGSCRCDPRRYPSCLCLDQLYWCPRRCDYDGTAGADAAGESEQLRA